MSVVVHFSTFTLLLLITSAQGYKVNITNLGNCDDVQNVKVNLTSVRYDYNDDGLCDTIHGRYYVHTIDPGLNYELWMTLYQCSSTVNDQCNDNARKYVVPLRCEKLHGDSSGPWYMLAKAMKGSKCGEMTGEFDLLSAKLLPEYLENYLVVDPHLTRHRIQMLFHKIGETGHNEHPRACVNMEFVVIT
ncbi:uncharacterized protein LOC119084677 [Bradysia coprophila]|uniref:uncharacterized protein LOC119084677 n=1 Tax=Bradysia coprophila TaxID=38358 RepID=UPI00187D741E|nr:uncharacterized protein LOC119084677 [Bradysia coprophila]